MSLLKAVQMLPYLFCMLFMCVVAILHRNVTVNFSDEVFPVNKEL